MLKEQLQSQNPSDKSQSQNERLDDFIVAVARGNREEPPEGLGLPSVAEVVAFLGGSFPDETLIYEEYDVQVTVHYLPALEPKSGSSGATVVAAFDANLNGCLHRFA